MSGLKKIVVLGAGFGGLCAATQIAKKLRGLGLMQKYEVILIDKNDHHTYTPLLYEVATTPKETAGLSRLQEVATYKINPLITGLPIKFIQSEIMALDLVRGDVHLGDDTELIADFVVLALGSETNYFGIAGLKENSLPLKSFGDAVKIRDAVWNPVAVGQAEVKIVVGGAGSTGVELAGEFRIWCEKLEKESGKCRFNVTLVEAMPTVLPGFEEKVIAIVGTRLKKIGVKMILGKKIVSAKKNEIVLDDGQKIPFDILVWTGGVKAPSILSKLPMEKEAQGRMLVADGLECLPQTPKLKLASMVYGLGDSICFYNPVTKKPIPGVARAAIIQGGIVAHNIVEEIKMSENKKYVPHTTYYLPKEYPYIIPVGGKYAVAKFGPIVISGFLGWTLKGLVELNYLFSIMPLWRALRVWLKGLKIFVQNDRLG